MARLTVGKKQIPEGDRADHKGWDLSTDLISQPTALEYPHLEFAKNRAWVGGCEK